MWLLGSSIFKHAQLEVFLRPGGLHLNLKRLKISLWWQVYNNRPDIVSDIAELKILGKVGPTPNAILIHSGRNDFGET